MVGKPLFSALLSPLKKSRKSYKPIKKLSYSFIIKILGKVCTISRNEEKCIKKRQPFLIAVYCFNCLKDKMCLPDRAKPKSKRSDLITHILPRHQFVFDLRETFDREFHVFNSMNCCRNESQNYLSFWNDRINYH